MSQMRKMRKREKQQRRRYIERITGLLVRPSVRLLSVDGTTDGGDVDATRYARERNRDV